MDAKIVHRIESGHEVVEEEKGLAKEGRGIAVDGRFLLKGRDSHEIDGQVDPDGD